MRFNYLIILILISCKPTTESEPNWPNIKIKPFISRAMEMKTGSYIIRNSETELVVNIQWDKIVSDEATSIIIYEIKEGSIIDTLKVLDNINKTETNVVEGIEYNNLTTIAATVKNSNGKESPLNKSNTITFNITRPEITPLNESFYIEINESNTESKINTLSQRYNLVDSMSVNIEYRQPQSTSSLDYKKIISLVGKLADNTIAKDHAVNGPGTYGSSPRRLIVDIDDLINKITANKIHVLPDYDKLFFSNDNFSRLKDTKGTYRIYFYLYKSNSFYRSDYLKEYKIQ